jgi:hypothetical protein
VVQGAVESLSKLEADPSLLLALRRRAFVEAGIGFIDGPTCPLCDEEWDEQQLRAHLNAKLEQSELAQAIQTGLVHAGVAIRNEVQRARSAIGSAASIGEGISATEIANLLKTWDAKLDLFQRNLSTVDELLSVKQVLQDGWGHIPDGVVISLGALRDEVAALPEESTIGEAQKFLILAQERLDRTREARRKEARCQRASKAASVAYAEYCNASESILSKLYEEVEQEFAKFYRSVNRDDEDEFEADLSPSAGKLDLEVDFYKRGKFPPGAYHSEGHQDGMGLCLYLALMKRVLGVDFRVAIFDDVVMSVDKDHRQEFCKLLRKEFPDTQFIITTHDKTWAKQMSAAGLVTAKSAVAFRGWKIDSGPLVQEIKGVWEEIARELEKENVSGAAGLLRRHLEFVFREIADEIAAPVPYRSDDNWELGDLFPGVLGRYKDLLKKAGKSASDWGNTEAAEHIHTRLDALSAKAAACGGEQWMINKAIHYNEWVDLTSGEFEAVVDAFRSFLEELACATCSTWVHITPKRQQEALRCDCGVINLNLLGK